jgi:dTDP-4-amino-4,6-dideoxygalactose transaminase
MKMGVPFLDFGPMHDPIKQEMENAFSSVYASNWFILGDHLLKFEKEYAAFSGTQFSVGVSNGLDALILSLRALGIGQGDDVIVPSNTYIASALAVTHVGARPVFVEPDKNTFNLNPELIEQTITLRTKAILPVHLYGQSCNMPEIMSIAEKHRLSVVEDNAQSHGATFSGQVTGSWGQLNATSFYPGKNLGALGDGGAVTGNSEDLILKVRALRNYGSTKKYYNDVIGFNNRLDELQAAFLSVKLGHMNNWTAQRQSIAEQYMAELEGVGDLILPYAHPLAAHVYHLLVVRTERRDELQRFLDQMGIGTLIHYPVPPHLQNAYKDLGYGKGDFPIAEKMAETCLSLPLYPGLTPQQVNKVSTAIRTFYNG